MTGRFHVLAEDYYAKEFLPKLLSKKGIHLPKKNVSSGRGKSRLLDDLKTWVKSLVELREVKKLIVLIDGDGRPEEILRKCEEEIPKDHREHVKIIVFEQELEEWVLKGLKIPLGDRKPSVILNDFMRKERGAKYGYERAHLPKLVELIDVELLQDDENFKRLLNLINDP